MQSVPNAPGSGFGPATSAAGGASSAGSGGPPLCSMPPVPSEPDASMPPPPDYAPLSWDEVMDAGPDSDQPESTEPAGPATSSSGSGGDRFLYPEGRGRTYYSTRMLNAYGEWVNEADSAWGKAARLLPGMVIVPLGAYASCGEHMVRSPGL